MTEEVLSDSSDGECSGYGSQNINEQQEEDTCDEVEVRLASFLLRLQTVLHVSKTAIQQIVTEFRDIVALVSETNRYVLDKALRQHGITDENTVNLVKDTLCQNDFSCLSEVGSLGTEKRRLSVFQRQFQCN